jgi:hypothetical protein
MNYEKEIEELNKAWFFEPFTKMGVNPSKFAVENINGVPKFCIQFDLPNGVRKEITTKAEYWANQLEKFVYFVSFKLINFLTYSYCDVPLEEIDNFAKRFSKVDPEHYSQWYGNYYESWKERKQNEKERTQTV